MTEIDTNPNSIASKNFEKQLYDMERQNKNKKEGVITIKTIKRGKVNKVETAQYNTDAAGRMIMQNRRMVNYNSVTFPIQETLHIENVNIQTYQYPAITKEPIANVFYMHSQHDYGGRYAFIGKMFAEKGIQFHTMDNRGHGKSEGKISTIE